jgi:hypothetical protein
MYVVTVSLDCTMIANQFKREDMMNNCVRDSVILLINACIHIQTFMVTCIRYQRMIAVLRKMIMQFASYIMARTR